MDTQSISSSGMNENTTGSANLETGYPDEVSFVSSRNSSACKRFTQAQEALGRDENFELAQRFMQGYRNLVQYEEFYRLDNRKEQEPLISVIVVAYNTGWELVKCIKSVFTGNLKQIEVIVVDNGKNAEVLPLLFSLPILYIKTPMNLILSEGRNVGVSAAKAPIAAFLDDDALADSNFCRSALEPFTDKEVYAVRGKVLPKTKEAFLGTNEHYDLGDIPIPHVINTEGNSVWRLDKYRDSGGMDPLLFGHEGTDISIRYTLEHGLGKTWYWPNLCIYHDFALTQEKSFTKNRRHELMTKFLSWKHPAAHDVGVLYYQILEEARRNAKKKMTLPEKISYIMDSGTSPKEPESVCFFIPTLGPGGAERQVVTLAKHFGATGKSVHILCLKLGGIHSHYLEMLKNTSVTFRVLNEQDKAFGKAYMEHAPEMFHSIFSLQINHDAVLAMAGALLQIKPDILHCYLDEASCIGGCAALACKTPGIVLSARNTTPNKLPDHQHLAEWTHTVYRFLLQHTNVLLEANSRAGAKDYEKWLNLSHNSIRVNNNGFDSESFLSPATRARQDVLQHLGVEASAPVVIWVGKYNLVKRPADLVAIASIVKDRMPEVRFLAVGSLLGRDEQCRELVREYQVQDTVLFLGPRQDIADLLHASDVLLHTSSVEGFPNAVMEAMITGLPVVSTEVGAVPEMLLPGAGFVHSVGDIEGMAESVTMLLNAPELRFQMGKTGKNRARHEFIIEKLGERTLTEYRSVFERGHESI